MAGMQITDLGRMDTPLMLFGGPYSNAQATQALLAQAAARRIAGAALICTGDVVAYCGAPAPTVALLQGTSVLAGNCERQIASGADDCGCGFDAGSACDLLSAAWYPFAAGQIDAPGKRWMAALPDLITFTHHGARYGVLHGGVTDIARFLWPDSPDADFVQEWTAFQTHAGKVDHLIAGHCGIPFVKSLPQGRWINPGVIGMPPHDGTGDTRFMTLEQGQVTLHRLSYDVAAAQADMEAAGLPRGYRDALARGYWPSEDVLPDSLRVPLSDRG